MRKTLHNALELRVAQKGKRGLGDGIADDPSPLSSSEINSARQGQIEKLQIEVALYTFAVEEGLRMTGRYKITRRNPGLLRYMRVTRKLNEKKLAERRRQLKALRGGKRDV